MSYRYACSHLSSVTDIPVSSILNSKEQPICADCDCLGPNLWICLYRGCLRIGCSENYNDHSTYHNQAQPNHCIHMNLSTRRVWCYQCETEVFMEPLSSGSYNDSDQEIEDCPAKSQDSGRGSYSTLRTDTPERNNVFVFEKTVGLNVGMSGDSTESSDGEDSTRLQTERPIGLVGLQNIGNTCYMNAALQALSNTGPLTNFFLECPMTVQILSEGRKPGLSRTYQTLMRDMWLKKNGGYVTPSGILYGIRSVHAMFRGYHQHDTQEFLRNFMDQLHEELKQICPPESSSNDADTFSLAMDEPALSSSYDSSEGEYETCDSGVSERSSLSDDTEHHTNTTKRRLSRSTSPGRRLRARIQNAVIDSQPSTSSSNASSSKKQTKCRSIISDIFDGKLLSSVQCLTCDRVSSRVETFQDLSLPIPSRDHLVVLHGRNVGPGVTCSEAVIPVQDGWFAWILAWLRSWFYGPTVSLHDCLAAFFSTDELKGDNMYSCERCNKLRNGIKFSKVLQLPEVLCIHLKRFRHELMFSSKISSFVSFPLRGLDMRPYLHSDCVSRVTTYELFSVICHHGTAGGGHYTCYSLNGGQWYEFDDQYVTRVSPETVQTCEAYVLFYRKNIASVQAIKSQAIKLSEVCSNVTEEAVYVSRQWLSRFNTCAEPGPIDNSDFLCHHGSVHPDRILALEQLALVLPHTVYDYLYKKFGGCPAVTTVHVCPACQALQRRILLEMETFVQLNREYQNQEASPTHILSTNWYSQWQHFVQKRTLEPPGPIDNSKINLNQCDSNREYVEVNEDIWSFFHNIYGGGPELRIRQNKFLRRTVSETSLQNSNFASNEDANEICDFVIPSLKKHEEKVETIDKAMYCHGEPMETEQTSDVPVNNTEVQSSELSRCSEELLVDTSEVQSPMEINQIETLPNGYANQISSNYSSTSNTSVTDDEVLQSDEKSEVKAKSPLKGKRRFRYKIGHKSKHIYNSDKSLSSGDTTVK